jgi:hypothetical protein
MRVAARPCTSPRRTTDPACVARAAHDAPRAPRAVKYSAPVAHAAHFLERLDRVPRSLTDFALSLYRDVGRVKWILHYAHLAPDVERVALALADGGEGPYIVVTREGKFVTALGAGMRPGDLPVLSRAQIDVFAARVDDQRQRFELASEVVSPGKRPADMLGLLTTRAWGLSRDEFAAIGAWAPILRFEFLKGIFEISGTLDRMRELYLGTQSKAFRRHERTREALEQMWNLSHGLGARYLLSAMGDLAWLETFASDWPYDYGPTWFATDERIASVAVRGAWAAARMGKPFLATYKRILSAPNVDTVHFDAALALTAIGLRHSHLRDDARRHIAHLPRVVYPENRGWAEKIVGFTDTAFDEPDRALDEVAAHGAKILVAIAPYVPEGGSFRFARAEDVPRETALAVAASGTFDSLHSFTIYLQPWSAKLASPDDLYLPEPLARVLRQPPSPEAMTGVYERMNVGRPPPPAAREDRPGRNEPCRCGSGKKYKKCCGR